MIAALAQRQIERLVNRALDRNPAARARLAELGDIDIVIRAAGPQLRLTLRVRAGVVSLEPASDGAPTALEISGSAPALLRIACDATSPLPQAVSISGDQTLFAELRAIQTGLNLDWEGELAAQVGDTPAHLLGLGAQQVLHGSGEALDRSHELLVNYLAEEATSTSPGALQRMARVGARATRAATEWLGALPPSGR